MTPSWTAEALAQVESPPPLIVNMNLLLSEDMHNLRYLPDRLWFSNTPWDELLLLAGGRYAKWETARDANQD